MLDTGWKGLCWEGEQGNTSSARKGGKHIHATIAMEIWESSEPRPGFLKWFCFPSIAQEFQKTLGGKQPVYDTTIRTGRALKEKALLSDDTQKLDNLLGEVRDKWDTVCGKSVER